MSGRPTLAAAVLAVAAAAPLAAAADTATVRAQAGRTYVGSIGSAGDSHVFHLDDFAPQVFSLSLKSTEGKTLEPDIELRDPLDVDVTPGLAAVRKDGPTYVYLKNATFPSAPGRYTLRVTGKNSTTGDYKLKVTTKVVRSMRGTGSVAGTPAFTVFAPTDASVRLKITPMSPGDLQPVYESISRPDDCLIATWNRFALGPQATLATFVSAATGDHIVTIVGAGATEGPFKWSAKVKPAKVPKTPVRVNGAPESYPAAGPLPARAVVTSGSSIRGIETDGVELSWREVRTSGGGPNLNKNSIVIARMTGSGQRNRGNDFAVDDTVTAMTFAMGSQEVVVVAEDKLFRLPREGPLGTDIDNGLGTVLRTLSLEELAYIVRSDLLRLYVEVLGIPTQIDFSPPAGTIQDACFGAAGIAYAVENGGDIEVRSLDTWLQGINDTLIGTIPGQASASAVIARGQDVFVAVDDGAGSTAVYRIDGCGNQNPVPIFTSTNPLHALVVDDANVYVMEDDATDGSRIVQVPRGGGVRQVLVRDSATYGFTMDLTDLAVAGGYVYFKADVSGTDTILRVKRTK